MPQCRFCATRLTDVVLDLGASPLANSYIPAERLNSPEVYFPLTVRFCSVCSLVQLEEYESAEHIFSDYDYFSSYSESWLRHAREYVAHMVEDYGIGKDSRVIEIASNDGYLLQYFLERGVGVLGVEPAANVAAVAVERGISTEVAFFGVETAKRLALRGESADLVLGNNVLAHVPDINDFVGGVKTVLNPEGVVTFEFPHLLNLVNLNQFDTIYHEHFSYLSLIAVERIFAKHGLRIFNVALLPTHGGSLRVYACHAKSASHTTQSSVGELIERERAASLDTFQGYARLRETAESAKNGLLEFLLKARREKAVVMGYGAAAKGNTMLNYAGVKPDLLSAVADLSPHKQGKYLPGTRIPVVSPERMLADKPDFILILPWNLKEEIIAQLREAREWGCRFVTAIPELKVWP